MYVHVNEHVHVHAHVQYVGHVLCRQNTVHEHKCMYSVHDQSRTVHMVYMQHIYMYLYMYMSTVWVYN